jgi:LGFP repeat
MFGIGRYFLAAVVCLGLTSMAFAYAVYGAIGAKYAALGGERGVMGAPMTDEADAPFGGRFNQFRNGYIYWHPQIGAFAVWGAIGAKWNEMGRVNYGYPITDELPTPDGVGRFNHFRALHLQGKPEASIYWTPRTGAHAIYGAIRDTWARQGWERGELGYPTNDEYQDGKYRRSDFERGYIRWSADTGIKVVKAGELIHNPPNTFGGLMVNGIEIARDNVPLAGNPSFLSENSLCRMWTSNLGQLNETFKNLIRSTANPRMRGFSIRSDARMHLTETCSVRAEVLTACGDTVTLRVALPRNLFLFHVTTPTIIGGWADPEFSIDFDLEARTQITVPKNVSGAMGVGRTTLAVSNIRLDSQNASGDLVQAVRKVYQLFTGNDLAQQLVQNREFSFAGIQSPVADLNPWLRRIPADYRIDACVNGNVLRLNAVNGPEPAGPIVR